MVSVEQQSDVREPVLQDEAPTRTRREHVLAYAILFIPLIAVGLAFWPGHMSADSLTQYAQAQDGGFTNHHAPLLSMLWWLGYHTVGAGPGWVLGLQVMAYLSGSYLLLRTLMRPWIAATVTTVIALLPPVFGMLGYVSRDLWFTSLLVLAFGMVARAGQRSGRERTAWLVGAVAIAWLCLASRQNAAPSVVVAMMLGASLILPALVAKRSGRVARAVRRRPAVAAVVAGVAVTLGLMATQVVAYPALGVQDVNPEQQLYLYDLAGMSLKENQNLIPPEVLADRRVSTVRDHWSVDTVGTYIFPNPPLIRVPLSEPDMHALSDEWREAVLDHPLAYLEVRTELFLRQIALTRDAVFIYHPVIDGNSFGLQVRFPEINAAAKDYVEAFASGPQLDGGIIYKVWVYLLLALGIGVFLLWRKRSWPALVAGGLALTAITYQSGIFLGAMATQYRWEFTPMVTTIIALPMLVGVLRAKGLQARR